MPFQCPLSRPPPGSGSRPARAFAARPRSRGQGPPLCSGPCPDPHRLSGSARGRPSCRSAERPSHSPLRPRRHAAVRVGAGRCGGRCRRLPGRRQAGGRARPARSSSGVTCAPAPALRTSRRKGKTGKTAGRSPMARFGAGAHRAASRAVQRTATASWSPRTGRGVGPTVTGWGPSRPTHGRVNPDPATKPRVCGTSMSPEVATAQRSGRGDPGHQACTPSGGRAGVLMARSPCQRTVGTWGEPRAKSQRSDERMCERETSGPIGSRCRERADVGAEPACSPPPHIPWEHGM